jgi:FlaA1/EpsC-like NDP-sugar epimerase
MFLEQKNTPRWMIFMIDILLAIVSIGFAYLLRFSFSIPETFLNKLPGVIAVVVGVRALSFVVARVYSGIIRYTGTQDLIRIFLVNTSGSVLFVATNLVLRHLWDLPHLIPYNIIIIDFFILTLTMTVYRILIKVAFLELYHPTRQGSGSGAEVIIFGAGDTGLMAKRAIERDGRQRLKVVAFIDDNPSKARKKLDNVIIHPLAKLEELLESESIDQVIIAVPTIKPQRKSEIVEMCLKHDVKVLSVPPVTRWIDGNLSPSQLQKIKIEDLLERDEIVINSARIAADLKGKTILISGAAGSIGSELMRQIVRFAPASMVLIDQAETPLYEIELEIGAMDTTSHLHPILCDITNKERLNRIFMKHKPHLVFHAAAYKHVPMMENNPREAVRTNVMGTKVIADLANEHRVERFIMVSTDKAVNPTSVMGASKRMAEIYTQTLNSQSNTRFITTRFGNVLGSNGSVITLFRKQIENGGPVTITHPKVTRYFMTIPEASRLVLEAASMGEGGEIFLFNMGESLRIVDLAHKMIRLSGLTPGTDIQIVYTGLRPGEKLFEELLNQDENTIHTGHPHILAAKVKHYEMPYVLQAMDDLILNIHHRDKFEVVKILKQIIPEYKSKNSVYEQFD